MKIHSVVARAVPVDGKTDMLKLTVTFCNFENAANNTHSLSYCYTNVPTAKLKFSTLLITNSATGKDPN